MRIAYLDAFAGISGDMFLGALIDVGVSVDLLRESLGQLHLGAGLELRKVNRSGIMASKVDVLLGDELAEIAAAHGYSVNGHHHGDDDHHHRHHHENHAFNGHGHSEHRGFSAICTLIQEADLPDTAKTLALRTFEELAMAESKIHGIPIEDVHFHEVGAVDAIADIVLVAVGVHALKIDAWHCSSLNVGGGTVQCAHGRFPVPAPATAELLRGAPTYSSGLNLELVTPTGAALIRALRCEFGPSPAMRVEQIGYGAGTRDPKGFANVLRISIGENTACDETNEIVTVIETAVDDMSPQVIAYVVEKALQMGALDVMSAPVHMKKNRLGTLITVLATTEKAKQLQELLLRETTSLGLRVRQDRRVCLSRNWSTVQTEWGPVRIKIAKWNATEHKAAPEYEDCRALAAQHAVPLKDVMASAMQIYHREDIS